MTKQTASERDVAEVIDVLLLFGVIREGFADPLAGGWRQAIECGTARKSIVNIPQPRGFHSVEELAERNIVVDFRPGALRISPYFYNTRDEIESVVSAMSDIRAVRK